MKLSDRPGMLLRRYLQVKAVAGNDPFAAAAYCASQRGPRWGDLQEIFKGAVGGMNSTSDSGLVDPIAQDYLALAAQFSVVEALMPNFRNVPPNVNCISQLTGATAYWSDQFQSSGSAIPLSASSLATSSLQPTRLASMSAISKELLRVSSPTADTLIANDLGRAAAAKLDWSFLDPTTSGSPSGAPASVSSSGRFFTASAGTIDGIDGDLEKLITALSDAGSNLDGATFIMNTLSAARLSRLRGSSGAPAYPGMSAKGGQLLGFKCLATSNIPRSGSPSPGASYVFMVDPSRIWMTAGGLEVATSDAVMIEQDNAPTQDASSGTAASQVSMFQTESLAIKATRYINWKPVSGQSHCATLTGVEW